MEHLSAPDLFDAIHAERSLQLYMLGGYMHKPDFSKVTIADWPLQTIDFENL